MSMEDKLVAMLIELHNEEIEQSNEFEKTTFESDVELESHYNHFGDRGVADLFLRKTEMTTSGMKVQSDKVFEIKSESAVKSATGSNEIIRQFNRMRKFFYKDEGRDLPDYYTFELCFIPSRETVRHVAENLILYQSATDQLLGPSIPGEYSDQNGSVVRFRYPEKHGQRWAPIDSRNGVHTVDNPTDWKDRLEDLFEADTERPVAKRVVSHLDSLGY